MTVRLPSQPSPDYFEDLQYEQQRGVSETGLVDIGHASHDVSRAALMGAGTVVQEIAAPEAREVETPRDEFIRKHSWTPHWEAEVTLANAGLSNVMGDRYTKAGLGAAESVLKKARGYLVQAEGNIRTLRDALMAPDIPQSLSTRHVKSPDGFEVRKAMAEHQLFSSALVGDGSWPNHKGATTDRKLQSIMHDIEHMSDEDVAMLWKGADSSADQRSHFWAKQLGEVEGSPMVQRIERDHVQRSQRR